MAKAEVKQGTIEGTDIVKDDVKDTVTDVVDNTVNEETTKNAVEVKQFRAIALLNIKFNGESYRVGEEFEVNEEEKKQLKGYATITEIK